MTRDLSPWSSLQPIGSESYVLPCDKPYIEYFNKHCNDEHAIAENQIPEPWLGPALNATLFVLQLNPYHPLNAPHGPSHPLQVAHQIRKHSLIGSLTVPHHGLATEDKFWRTCFSCLAEDIGRAMKPMLRSSSLRRSFGYNHLASRVCSVEYFPYPSDKSNHALLRLPSQQFTFGLVRYGIQRGARFVVLKGWNAWKSAVPELNSHRDVHQVVGYRGARSIPRSVAGYRAILDALLG